MRDGDPSATPVFVDPTGRRATAVRVVGSLTAVTAVGFLLAVMIVMTTFPQPPHAAGGRDVRANAHTAFHAETAATDTDAVPHRPDAR